MALWSSLIRLTFLLSLISLSSAGGNSISCVVNPSCQDCKSPTTSLAHVMSVGDKFTNHFVWSFITGFSPTLFFFESDNAAVLDIDWTKLRSKDNSNSIKFVNGTVHKAYGTEITSFNFQDGKATNFYDIPLRDLQWQMTYDCQGKAQFQFKSLNGTGAMNGTFTFSSSVFESSGRYDEIPHLAYTTSSSIFNIQLNNIYSIKFPSDADTAVFPFANLTVAYEGEKLSGDISKTSSINDEYSPGVFKRFVYEIKEDKNNIAFTEWRPVAYYDTDHVVAKSIKVGQPDVLDLNVTEPTTLLNAYFGKKIKQLQSLNNFQFGSADDSFDYKLNSFVSFTMGSGFGEAQPDSLSGSLKLVLFVGLGVPAVLVALSAVYTVYLKCSTRKPEFETLEE